MLAKFSVKKPLTVLVAVIIILVFGVISYIKMTPDLFPSINMPYAIVMTTYPGASPEEVENQVIALLRERTVRHGDAQPETEAETPNYEDLIRRENGRLARLYALYADGDDALAQVIAEKKKQIRKWQDMQAQQAQKERDRVRARSAAIGR